MIDKIEILKKSADYIENPWENDFPWINDDVEIIDIDDSSIKCAKILDISWDKSYKLINEYLKIIFCYISNDHKSECSIGSICLLPSQLVSGKYEINGRCYILKKI